MKICLVTPPSGFLLEARVFAALGILKIAAVLEREGYIVDHLDLSGIDNYEEAVRGYSGGASVFGVTVTTPQMPAAVRIASVLRGVPGRRLIIGGPHPTLVNSAYKRGRTRADGPMKQLLDAFDVVVAGDGEDAIFQAMSPFFRGIIDADDPHSPLWQTNQKFTDSPWPARHLIDVSSYHYSIEGEPALHVIGQLGCPLPVHFLRGEKLAHATTYSQS